MLKYWLLSILALLFSSAAMAADQTDTLPGTPKRHFIVHLPPHYDGITALPAVLVFHGGGGTPEGMRSSSGFNDIADKYGFIAVYPAGSSRFGNRLLTWNAGNCCGYAQKQQIDDVAFVAGMIGQLIKDYHIDPRRIYATGHSNGAQMSYRLACELSGRIAAIAPVAGQIQIPSCSPKRPVPVLHIHGTADKCALYEGGDACGNCFNEVLNSVGIPMPKQTWACRPVEPMLASLARAYGCQPQARPGFSKGAARCSSYTGCNGNAEVTLCRVEGGGHAWPGAPLPSFCEKRPQGRMCQSWQEEVGPENNDINPAELAWAFFQRFSL